MCIRDRTNNSYLRGGVNDGIATTRCIGHQGFVAHIAEHLICIDRGFVTLQTHNLVAASQQRFNGSARKQTAGTGDQNFHQGHRAR